MYCMCTIVRIQSCFTYLTHVRTYLSSHFPSVAHKYDYKTYAIIYKVCQRQTQQLFVESSAEKGLVPGDLGGAQHSPLSVSASMASSIRCSHPHLNCRQQDAVLQHMSHCHPRELPVDWLTSASCFLCMHKTAVMLFLSDLNSKLSTWTRVILWSSAWLDCCSKRCHGNWKSPLTCLDRNDKSLGLTCNKACFSEYHHCPALSVCWWPLLFLT